MKRQEKVCRPTGSSGEIMSIGNRSRQNQQLKEGLYLDKETHRAGWRRRRPWTAGSGKQERAQLLPEVWACVSLGRVFPLIQGWSAWKKTEWLIVPQLLYKHALIRPWTWASSSVGKPYWEEKKPTRPVVFSCQAFVSGQEGEVEARHSGSSSSLLSSQWPLSMSFCLPGKSNFSSLNWGGD